jgi:hypothetical protein
MLISRVRRPSRRLPLAIGLVCALSLVGGMLQQPQSVSLVQLHGVQLASFSLGSLYQPGELFGGGSSSAKCMACTGTELINADKAQSIQPGQAVNPLTGDFTTSETLFNLTTPYADMGVSLTYDA